MSIKGCLYHCAGAAAGVNACVVAGYEATCLGDLFVIPAAVDSPSPTGVIAPTEPVPVAVVLDHGIRCRLRVGGSRPARSGTPALTGRYLCPGDSGFRAIWGRGSGPGHTETTDGSTVEFGRTAGNLETRRGVEPYFIRLRRQRGVLPPSSAAHPPTQC